MVVCGIDPSARATGIAILEDNDLGYVGVIKNLDCESALFIRDLIRDMETDIVVIEDQYLRHATKGTVKFVRAAGFWHCVSAMAGINPTWVTPSSWQSAELGMSPQAGRSSLKRAAISRCIGLFGAKLPSDAADAALIARYGMIRASSGPVDRRRH